MKQADGSNGTRPLFEAEQHVPQLLQDFLRAMERTSHSSEVWHEIVKLGRTLNLPYIDFVTASSFQDWKRTQFIRTSYDSSWLHEANADPDVQKWSYFRAHAIQYLTPIAVGLAFADEYQDIPEARLEVLRSAARHGLRAGFSIPLRLNTPPQAALITFSGDHGKREMREIIRAHGWTLNVAALVGHQRYALHFSHEFAERNRITDKQKEILALIGQGLPDKSIAEQLGVSISAVRQRMHTLLQNTGLNSRAELAALAMSVGVLPDPLQGPDQGAQIRIEMDNAGIRSRPK